MKYNLWGAQKKNKQTAIKAGCCRAQFYLRAVTELISRSVKKWEESESVLWVTIMTSKRTNTPYTWFKNERVELVIEWTDFSEILHQLHVFVLMSSNRSGGRSIQILYLSKSTNTSLWEVKVLHSKHYLKVKVCKHNHAFSSWSKEGFNSLFILRRGGFSTHKGTQRKTHVTQDKLLTFFQTAHKLWVRNGLSLKVKMELTHVVWHNVRNNCETV